MTTLPEKMRLAGYIPHAVGKWHCGMATERQTPAGRGYESWLGYFGACNDCKVVLRLFSEVSRVRYDPRKAHVRGS